MSKRKVIIDVDTGVDDAQAIMLALSRPEIEVLGITCVSGNVALDDVCRNTLRVLQACGRLDIPVYKGVYCSIKGETKRAKAHGGDGLGDVEHPESVDTKLLQFEHAVHALLRLVNKNKGEITLVALAPHTNIALAVRLDPDFGRKLKEVFIMGGNVSGKGNLALAAEFNFCADPEAAYITLRDLKCPITIVSLETTESLGIQWDWFDMWANVDTEKGRFHKAISAKTAFRNRITRNQPDFALYDLLTMAIAIDKSIITKSGEKWVTVETSGEHVRGQLIIDWNHMTNNPSNVKIVEQFDMEKAKQYYMGMVV